MIYTHFSRLDWRIFALSCLIWGLLGLFTAVPSAEAQTVVRKVEDISRFGFVNDGYEDCGLRRHGIADVSIRPDRLKQQEAAATITVDYSSDFTAEARAAFERAVEVWENHIASPVEIRIDANRLTDAEPGVLGAAGPSAFWVIDPNQGNDFIVGSALADALDGSDVERDSSDITARFNLDRDDWHFGESDAPSSQLDFTTVVLHEIGHGLNFLSLCRTTSGGIGGEEARCKFEVDGDLLTDSYTQALAEQENDNLTFLTNESVYPNPSSDLLEALTSDQLVFSAPNAELAAEQGEGPSPPKIYAPFDYEGGSSISHNDEETYPTGTTNSLMTPNLAAGETVRLPGPLVCGHLLDVGWTAGAGCAFDEVSIESVTAAGSESSSNQGTASLSWTLSGGAVAIERFVVEQIYFGQKKSEKTIDVEGPREYSTSFTELDVGEHSFRVNYVTTDGNKVQTGEIPSVKISAQSPDVAVYPNPFDERVNVSFTLPETQDVSVEVFDVLGRRVATFRRNEVDADDPRPVQIRASELGSRSSGVYFIRVDGETFEETIQAARVR